jgi:hypothetical protein
MSAFGDKAEIDASHAAVDRLKGTKSYKRAAIAGPKIWRTRAAELSTPCSRFSATSGAFVSPRWQSGWDISANAKRATAE